MATIPWARLPVELIQKIILFSSHDPATLHAWCTATTDSYDLWQTANSVFWNDVQIHHTDLVASPDEVDLEENRYSANLTSQSGIIYAITRPASENINVLPIEFVRKLCIDFSFECLRHMDIEILAPLPTGETLEYSLGMIFPLLSNVREINVAGVLPQELLNRITSQSLTELRTLVLRQFESSGHFVTEGQNGQSGIRQLDWQQLIRLQLLQNLEIYNLKGKEAESLAGVVTRLQLKTLWLGTSDPTPFSTEVDHLDRVSPLTQFFNFIYPSQNDFQASSKSLTEYGLPTTLESLVVLDHAFQKARNGHIPATVNPFLPSLPLSCPILTHAYISLTSYTAAIALVSWLAAPKLTHISIPIVPRLHWPVSYHIRFNQSIHRNTQPLNDIIANHTALQEVRILDVLDGQRSSHRAYGGLSCPLFKFEDHVQYILPEEHHTSHIRRNHMKSYETIPWFRDLQHLRIYQHVERNTHLEAICQYCRNLRILIISPCLYVDLRSDHHAQTAARAMTSSSGDNILDSYAKKIRTLSIVILGRVAFWVERVDESLGDYKVWCLQDAQSDPVQSEKMLEELSIFDWDFIRRDPFEIPRKPFIRLGDTSRSFPDLMDTNYVALRREQT